MQELASDESGGRLVVQEQQDIGKCPAISVGMPVFNGERYVAQSIQAVLDQTFTDFELIISDNASTDRTEEICRDLASVDSRIRYVRNVENIGAAKNYNQLVDLARGKYFRWSNADDLLAPELHERCYGELEADPDAVLAYGKTDIIDEHGKKIRSYDDNLHLPQTSAFERFRLFQKQVGLTNIIYGLMRTDAVRQTNIFGDGTLPAADISFMAELTLQGKFLESPETLFYRRMHSGASSHDRSDNERQANFWRAKPTPFQLPTLRQAMRYLRKIWATKIEFREKWKLSFFVLRGLVWQRSEIASEFVAVIRRN